MAEHLQTPAAGLDVTRGDAIDELSALASRSFPHSTPTSVRRLAKVAHGRWLRHEAVSGSVLVIPQDVDVLFRAAAAACRRGGSKLALMPDGVARAGIVGSASRFGPLSPAVDRVLHGSGLVLGERGRMGASEPDLCLSWGPGWDAVWRAACPSARIACVGNPLADRFAALPSAPQDGRVLVCSQPLTPKIVGSSDAMTRWYDWLNELAAVETPARLRIRLHPAETDVAPPHLSPAALRCVSSGTLAEDLSWSDLVVACFSTTLLDAVAAGRDVLSVQFDESIQEIALGFLVFGDSDFPVVHSLDGLTPERLRAFTRRNVAAKLQSGYLVNVGTSAARVAAELDALTQCSASVSETLTD